MDRFTVERLTREWEQGTISMEDRMHIIAASVAKLIQGFDVQNALIGETREELQASLTKQLDVMSIVIDKLEEDLDKAVVEIKARLDKLENNNG